MQNAPDLTIQRVEGVHKRLEPLFLFSLVVHLFALAFMALFILPGLPGSGHALPERISYVSAHPWQWRLGWLPWQLAALSDVAISVALLRAQGISRPSSLLILFATLAAVVPDQVGEALWITRGVSDATMQHTAVYAGLEAQLYALIAGYGACCYSGMAAGWSWSLAELRLWHPKLSWPSAAVWAALGLSGIGVLLVPQLPAYVTVPVNAAGFAGLVCWFAVITEVLLRQSRPARHHGRDARWTHPNQGVPGRGLNLLANSQLVHCLGEIMPLPAMVSDIRDVIYVNYLVEADRLAALVPAKLDLQRLGPEGKYALFTFLTYKHGHFGPALLGPLRKLLPSPIQTNWRIYVNDPVTETQGVYFVTNAITSTAYALGARLLAQGMPMHVLRSATVDPVNPGEFKLVLDPGNGSAPQAEAVLHVQPALPLSGPWSACFASYRDMLAYCVPQDRALSSQVHRRRITRQEIALDIPLEACEPLDGTVQSKTVADLIGDAEPFCFRVARVEFRLCGQQFTRVHP